MAGSITPLPIMQLEDEEDRKRYAAMEAPKSIVVRYGYLKFIAELPYDGKEKPGCGSKVVIMTQRGVEMGEMLTTTCGNSGCGKSVSRKQMLEYIENSGGKDFPFTNQGKVVRVATVEDVLEQKRLEDQKMEMIRFCKLRITELGLPMKLVDIERLLGGERIIFHYTSESWVDFRELVKLLAAQYQTRIEMHQVNARDEARLVADYEKCGQHCCCKQFLKVLKPVSMRSAKIQKATLDPTKISGRCGRLMCCLRYEDETYDDLRKRLPHRQTRIMTDDGPGTVIDTQILTQLVLTALDSGDPPAAYPLENIEILDRDHPQYRKPEPPEPMVRHNSRDRAGSAHRNSGPSRQEQDHSSTSGTDQTNRVRETDTPSMDSPQRPRPGRPLGDDQVESKEGRPGKISDPGAGPEVSSEDTADPSNTADRSAKASADGGSRPSAADGPQASEQKREDGTGKQGDGQDQSKRRRRGRNRKRGRGKGRGGPDGAAGSAPSGR